MHPNKTINLFITINANTAVVWDILTNPDKIKIWLSDSDIEVISDWITGSPISFTGEFHRHDFNSKGTILKFEPEKVFQYSYWTKISQLPDKPENYFLIEFKLTPEKSGTVLSLEMRNTQNDVIYGHWNFYWKVTLEIIKKLCEQNIQFFQIKLNKL